MRNLTWGIILISLGLLLLLDNMDIVELRHVIRMYWPALLVLWGVAILVRRRESHRMRIFREANDTVDGEHFHESSVFGSLRADVTSQHFKGGSVSTVFGNASIDLSHAVVADGEHRLRVNGVFGDMKLTTPKEVAVAVSGSALFGDVRIFDVKRGGFSLDAQYVSPGYDSAPKKLNIAITVVFGSISVD